MIWYINGSYMDSKRATIELDSPGSLYGYGVFTTLRVQNGEPLFLSEHLKRLEKSCTYFNIPFKDTEYRKILSELAEQNQQQNLRIKIIISLLDETTSVLIVTAETLNLYESSIKIMLAPKPRELCVMNRFKTTNYMLPVFFKGKATKAGFDEMLFFNSTGDVLETCYANIFFVRNRYIYTPSMENNILPGIIRNKLLEQTEINGYHIVEKSISLAKISEYESSFTTNSIQHIRQICNIGDVQFQPMNKELIETLKAILK
ncbi:MAG: aminotransferase class IV [Candidatus Zophobacter franzmannii]|nr:aminotransferase class IV [Candidatus Zophobacter franzmannii]